MAVADFEAGVPALVSMGLDFAVKGDVFEAVLGLVNKLLAERTANPEGLRFLESLHAALVQSSVPVRPKLRSAPSLTPPEQLDVVS
jgi:hypothetical protein